MRLIKVEDSEVKAEKFLSEEEKALLEKQRLEQEMLLKAMQSNDSRERALMMMMGGKLEDRSEENEKVELVQPEWMKKPKEEMTEEEKMLVKEFEKKKAIFKEEQEKYKKALETELRKLQTSIQEICANFDAKLKEFLRQKIETDQVIFQKELQVAKLSQSLLLMEDNVEQKETEKVREEYEACLRKDKELERQFKKEFLQNDFKFEDAYQLFKRRDQEVEVTQAPIITDYSDAILIHKGQVESLNSSIVTVGETKVEAIKDMKDYRKGIHALEWENKMLDFQAEDLVIHTRDIQLLRITKQMQEYIRSGDEKKQSNEVAVLEKQSEHGQKAQLHKIEDKQKIIQKYLKKVAEKRSENRKLEERLRALDAAVMEQQQIQRAQAVLKTHSFGSGESSPLKEIHTRRKLVDLAKSQAQDIAILREEVERLRLRTYPAFPASLDFVNNF
ncbi:Cilia- and flagella-associated protein 43 [Cladochytrium tenue]|nr:Cilia- and flagella-associated protein 43 [Cladochytrium tenue]